jgi:hypothetical protein
MRRLHAPATPLSPAAGTYGNVFVGFDVTDSLPIPSRTGVFDARENMTSGALSVTSSRGQQGRQIRFLVLGFRIFLCFHSFRKIIQPKAEGFNDQRKAYGKPLLEVVPCGSCHTQFA